MANKNQNQNKRPALMRVIYPNRHLFWAIAIMVIVGAALVSYIYVSGISESSQFVFSESHNARHFTSKTQHYSATYPVGWQLETDQSGNTIFENPQNPNEDISVTTAELSDESMIRNYLNIKNEEDFTLNGFKYALIENVLMKGDGSMNQVAIIETPWRLYYVFGNSPRFNDFVLNLKFEK